MTREPKNGKAVNGLTPGQIEYLRTGFISPAGTPESEGGEVYAWANIDGVYLGVYNPPRDVFEMVRPYHPAGTFPWAEKTFKPKKAKRVKK